MTNHKEMGEQLCQLLLKRNKLKQSSEEFGRRAETLGLTVEELKRDWCTATEEEEDSIADRLDSALLKLDVCLMEIRRLSIKKTKIKEKIQRLEQFWEQSSDIEMQTIKETGYE